MCVQGSDYVHVDARDACVCVCVLVCVCMWRPEVDVVNPLSQSLITRLPYSLKEGSQSNPEVGGMTCLAD